MRFLLPLLFLVAALVAGVAAFGPRLLFTSKTIAAFAKPQEGASPPAEAFAPEQWFSGKTESIGVIERSDGEPLSRIRTRTEGSLTGGVLVMAQTLDIEGEAPRVRNWRVSRRDDGLYILACDDMAAPAMGTVSGRTLRMEYDLRLDPDATFGTVHATHWMHLQDDGRTILNRVTFTKLGVVVASVSESFRRLDD